MAIKQPSLGKAVLWFEGGQRDHGGAVAIVTAVAPSMVRVNVLFAGNGSMRATGWIRHVDDPYYIDHPKVAQDNGAWDWLPEDLPPDPLDQAMAALPEMPQLSHRETVDRPKKPAKR